MNNHQYKLVAIIITIFLFVTLFLGCIGNENNNGKEKKSETVLTVILSDNSEHTFSLDELKKLEPIERKSSYQNRLGNIGGEGTYKSVSLKTIFADISSNLDQNSVLEIMIPGDTLRVIAKDGYYQDFCYYNVYPPDTWYQFQGDFCIAYSFDGSEISSWDLGPMSVFLPMDEEYSLEDCNATSALDQGYFKTSSAGARFVKNTEKIEIIRGKTEEWQLALIGNRTEEFTKTDYEMLEYYFKDNYTDDNKDAWSGVPLWRIIARVDDDGPIRGENDFNLTLSAMGYEVKIYAGDGYSKSISSALIAQNNRIILANKKNGELLSNEEKPLRVVGEGLSKSQQVGNVVKIKVLVEEIPSGPTAVAVIGEKTVQYSMEKLKSLTATTGSGGFKKSTGTIVGLYTYKGVKISNLLDAAGRISSEFSLEAKAGDGYTMVFTMEQIDGKFVTYDSSGESLGINQVTMILAYEEIGKSELDGGPLRILLVGDNSPITDGHFWIKDIVQLKMIENVEDWSIELYGLSNYIMNRSSFESLATCSYHRMWYNYTDKDEIDHHYEVVPLWILISIIDGIVAPNNFYFFNDFLAQVGYNITITATDGFSISFDSQRVARNDSILLAFKDNEQYLDTGSGGPLRIVGSGLTGKESIRNIAFINMTEIPQVSEWSFNLTGLTFIKVTQSFFIAMASHHLVWCNISEKGVDKHYQGIPLYYLLGVVDDGDELGHFGLNMTLALLGYEVVIKATDGFSANFDSVRVARNRSIILVYLNDGLPLNTSEGGPVRLVGVDLTGKERVKNIIDISFININTVKYSPGILTIKGKPSPYTHREVNVSLTELKGFPSYTGLGGFKNKVETITGPFNYTGVNISSLLWLIDGLKVGDSVRITSSDGYNRTFTYDQINGALEIFDKNGTSLGTGSVIPVLAYSEEGGELSDCGPLRLVFVDNDFVITASGFWLKDVVMIEVVD